MRSSIRTKVMKLLFSFAFAFLLVLGAGSLYFMEQGTDFASRYAAEISDQAIDNSSDIIIAMRQEELLSIVKKTAGDIRGFTEGVRRDVHLLTLEMERIWADPAGYQRTVVTPAREDQLFDETVDVDTLDQTVFSFITYAPGVDPASVQEEVAVTSNIQDFLVAFAEQAQMSRSHNTSVLGTKSGFLMKGDLVASPPNLEFRNSVWYRTAMEKGELSFSPVYRIQGQKITAAVACTEPYRRNGEIIGVIGFGLGLNNLEKLMRDSLATINEVNPNGFNFMLDEQGRVIFCQHIESGDDKVLDDIFGRIKKFELFPSLEDPAFAEAVEDMKKGGTKILGFEQQGQRYTLAYAPVEGMDWSVGAVIPKPNVDAVAEKNRLQIQSLTDNSIQDLTAGMRRGSLYILLLTLLLASFGVYSSRKLSNRLVNPLLELREGVKEIATGNLDRKIALNTDDEIEEVADAINAMTIDLKAYIDNISRITAEKERIAMELNVARDIQAGGLPHDFQFPCQKFELYATMDTAKEVGGDFYDFYMLDENHLAVTIADVSGKGVPAALFMMRSQTILKNLAMMSAFPDDYAAVVTLANQQLCENNEEDMFVTVFFGVLDIKTGDFAYVNGGHNPPLICHEEKYAYLRMEKKSCMLGLIDFGTYHEYHVTLAPGDMLFLYTDGVTEAMNEAEEMYSEERLQETLNAQGEKDVREILAAVRQDVAAHTGAAEQSDDITMLGVRFLGA